MGFRILIICFSWALLAVFPPVAGKAPCLAASNESTQAVDVEAIFSGHGPESQETTVSSDFSGVGTAVSAAVLFVCLVTTATCGRQLHRIIERKRAAISATTGELNDLIEQAVEVNTKEYEKLMDELAALDTQEEQLARHLEGLDMQEVV